MIYKLLPMLFGFACLSIKAACQNLIANPSFEVGAIPTGDDQVPLATDWYKLCATVQLTSPNNTVLPGSPDLFDNRSPSSCNRFNNKWGNVTERTGKFRYVGFTGGMYSVSSGDYYYGESVEGRITQPLQSGCTNHISFYAVGGQGWAMNGCPGAPAVLTPHQYDKIEVVLRKNNDCIANKVVFTSPVVTNTNWVQYGGAFTLSVAEAAIGYNRIEFRFTKYPTTATVFEKRRVAFLDDINLSVIQGGALSSDFTLEASNPIGSTTTYIVKATTVPLPPHAGFYWEVSELDLNTGAVIPGTTMANPPNWWSPGLVLVNTFPGYCCNPGVITGNGTFLLNHKYKITRGVWSGCNVWGQTSKIVYMRTN